MIYIIVFFITLLSGCYNSSVTFCQNLSKEYSRLLIQDETVKIHSWENLYVHHDFLIKPLLENREQSSIEKEQFFSLTFYAFLMTKSALKCGAEQESEGPFKKKTQVALTGLTKIETESHPYFKCLLSEWKKWAKPLIFKSCKYYFTR